MATSSQELCSVKHLSDELGIPYKFLGRLMSRLGSEGIVAAVRGKNGGYQIIKPLGEVRLAHIVDIVEGLESYDRCILGFETCDDENPCPMHDFWTVHKNGISQMMQDVTLAQMVATGSTRI